MIERLELTDNELTVVLDEYNKIVKYAIDKMGEHCDLYGDRIHHSIEFNDFGMAYINAFIDNTLSVTVSFDTNESSGVVAIKRGNEEEFEVRTDKHGDVIYITVDLISDFIINEFELLK